MNEITIDELKRMKYSQKISRDCTDEYHGWVEFKAGNKILFTIYDEDFSGDCARFLCLATKYHDDLVESLRKLHDIAWKKLEYCDDKTSTALDDATELLAKIQEERVTLE